MSEREHPEVIKQQLIDRIKILAEGSWYVMPALEDEAEEEKLRLMNAIKTNSFEEAENIIYQNKLRLQEDLERTKNGNPIRPLPGLADEDKHDHNITKIGEGLELLKEEISEQIRKNDEMLKLLGQQEGLSK